MASPCSSRTTGSRAVLKVPSISFITLGCPKNEVDTDRMRAAVIGSAYTLSDDIDDADVDNLDLGEDGGLHILEVCGRKRSCAYCVFLCVRLPARYVRVRACVGEGGIVCA